MYITKKNDLGNWILVNNYGTPVSVGDPVQDFRGDLHTIKGGTPPHKPSSTGRVRTDQGEFFPSVVDLVWFDDNTIDEPDESMDGDAESALASAGWGTDEDYGSYE